MASPIADLSYRNYDGPLEPPLYRWWPIARTSVLRAFKNKWFWVLTVATGIWYLILMIIFYMFDTYAQSMLQGRRGGGVSIADPEEAAAMIFRQVPWNEQFLHGFSIGQIFFFFIALLVGIGAIANDNRANALLVYLSKPCTKFDYVLGKWLGIFIPMCVAAAIPTFFFYAYCFMSYREFGFLRDPWLFAKLIVLCCVPAAFHASLALGVSSLFKRGGLAGATYAGLYFISLFFTKAMQIVHIALSEEGGKPGIVDSLFYYSIDGIQIGIAKALLGTDGGMIIPFNPPGQMQNDLAQFTIPAPNGLLMFTVLLLFAAGSMLLAWSRVRAVEVVS